MTNEQILNLYDGLYEIGQDKNLKFNATTSFLLAKNKNMIAPLYDSIYETRMRLIKKYGEQQEDGWFIPNENLDSFKIEFESLMKMDTFVAFEEVPLSALENEKININLMEKLIPIIKKQEQN